VKALIAKGNGLPGDTRDENDRAAHANWAAFRRGVLTNLLNPKVALFFLALLPQFIDAASTRKVGAFLALGLSFVFLGVLWCVMLAIAAARLRGVFLRRPSMATVMNKVAGALFIGLGIRLAAARP
jgi:threonine/homoserine/homoserine lactone efflux protein